MKVLFFKSFVHTLYQFHQESITGSI